MIDPPINTENQKLLVGHSIGKARASYKKPSDERLLEEYTKAIPFFTIDPSNLPQTKTDPLAEQQKDDRITALEKQLQAQGEMLKKLYVQGVLKSV